MSKKRLGKNKKYVVSLTEEEAKMWAKAPVGINPDGMAGGNPVPPPMPPDKKNPDQPRKDPDRKDPDPEKKDPADGGDKPTNPDGGGGDKPENPMPGGGIPGSKEP